MLWNNFFLDYLERTTGARVPGKGHMPTKRQQWQQLVLKGMSFFRSVSIRDRSKCAMWPGTFENTGWNFPGVRNVVLLIQGTTKKKKKGNKKEEEEKKKTICIFRGVEHYQQTEKKRFRPKMLIALACCKNYYLKNNTQNRFNLLSIFFLWFCLLEAQN